MQYQAESNPITANINYIKKQIEDTCKKIGNIMTAIENGIFTPSTKSRLEELEDNKKGLQLSLNNEKLKSSDITRKDLFDFLKSLKNGSVEDKDFQKYIINTFVSKCYITDKEITIICDLFSTQQTVGYTEIRSILGNPEGFAHCYEWWR